MTASDLDAHADRILEGWVQHSIGHAPSPAYRISDPEGIDPVDLFSTLVNFVGMQGKSLYLEMADGEVGIVKSYGLQYSDPGAGRTKRKISEILDAWAGGHEADESVIVANIDIVLNPNSFRIPAYRQMLGLQKRVKMTFKLSASGELTSGRYEPDSDIVVAMGPAQPLSRLAAQPVSRFSN